MAGSVFERWVVNMFHVWPHVSRGVNGKGSLYAIGSKTVAFALGEAKECF